MLLRFHVQTAGSTLTAQQPNNNLVRVTLQALAAILGGCQSLHTNSRDEALGLPTELSATLALRTQQILAEESGVANTIDPVGGSYAVEAETDRIEAAAKNRLDEIEGMGGSLRAIERGYFQKSIAERAYQYQQEIERKERGIVGVNVYTTDAIHPPPILRVDPVLEKRRKARLAKLRNERDTPRTERALLHLGEAARSEENLVPFILTAVEALATLGEISDRLRTVFGQYHSPDALV